VSTVRISAWAGDRDAVDGFRGFVLQARDETGAVRGAFDVEASSQGVRVLSCVADNDTATHGDPSVKQSVDLVWNSAPLCSSNDIYFRYETGGPNKSCTINELTASYTSVTQSEPDAAAVVTLTHSSSGVIATTATAAAEYSTERAEGARRRELQRDGPRYTFLSGHITCTQYIDAAYCYRCSVVCVSLLDITVSHTETVEPIEVPFGDRSGVGQRNNVLGGPRSPVGRSNLGGGASSVSLSSIGNIQRAVDISQRHFVGGGVDASSHCQHFSNLLTFESRLDAGNVRIACRSSADVRR